MPPLTFFGSSPFSVIVLEKVLGSRCQVIGVVTTPDKPVGRHLQLTPNPVKVLAQKHNIPAIESLEGIASLLAALDRETIPIGLVAAYGQIIPQSVIDAFDGRIYNIHPSLLPKYRGPSPLQQQILDGVTETGVTIIQLDAQMDHGPILIQEKSPIYPNDTTASLGEKLFTRGVNWFIENYLEIENWKLKIQDDSQATYTQKLTRADGFVDYTKFTAALVTHPVWLDRMFRAYHPWPGVWTHNPSGQRVKLVSLTPPTIQIEGRSPQLLTRVIY